MVGLFSSEGTSGRNRASQKNWASRVPKGAPLIQGPSQIRFLSPFENTFRRHCGFHNGVAIFTENTTQRPSYLVRRVVLIEADVPAAAISSSWDFSLRVLVIFFRFLAKEFLEQRRVRVAVW